MYGVWADFADDELQRGRLMRRFIVGIAGKAYVEITFNRAVGYDFFSHIAQVKRVQLTKLRCGKACGDLQGWVINYLKRHKGYYIKFSAVIKLAWQGVFV